MTTLFISDLHLSAQRPGAVELFLRFARDRAVRASALYILGDLFDAWIGDDDESELAAAVRGALRAVTNAGAAVHFQAGNRDFLVGEGFTAATGVVLLPEATVAEVGGAPALLMHGDQTSRPVACCAARNSSPTSSPSRSPHARPSRPSTGAAAARPSPSRRRTSWT